jgi:hypothetical protein
MRRFLKWLASVFVVLGGIASAIGLLIFLFSASTSIPDKSGASLGVATIVSGVGVMLAAGAVYLLIEIAGVLIDPQPTAPTPYVKPRTSLTIPPSARP